MRLPSRCPATWNRGARVPNEKKYSLISVDVAPDEEVLRVDAAGVHEQTAPQSSVSAAPADSAQGEGRSSAADGECADVYATAPNQRDGASAASKAAPSHAASQDSYQATEEDLQGPVPMAGLQKAIIAVVVLCLVGFAVYFGFTH